MDHLDSSAILGMVEDLNRALRGVDATQHRISEVTVTAWSQNRLIKAVVGPRGQLVELDIDQQAVRRYKADELAAVIVAVVRAAAESALDRTQEIMRQQLPDMRRVLGTEAPGSRELARMAFGHDADPVRTTREDDRESSR